MDAAVQVVRILVLDSNETRARELAQTISWLGYRPDCVPNGHAALQHARKSAPDLLLVATRAGAWPLEVGLALRRECNLPVLLLVEGDHQTLLECAEALEPDCYLNLPIEDRSLGLAIEAALRRARQTREMLDTQAQFQGILVSTAEGLIVSAEDGNILFANPRAETLLGYGTGELVGLTVEVLVPERLRGQHQRMRQCHAVSPEPRPMGKGLGLIARRKDGSEFPADISLSVRKTLRGTVVTSIIQDISARVRAEAELLRVNRMLRVLSKGNEALIRADSESTLVQTVCDAIVGQADYPSVWVAYTGSSPGSPMRVAAGSGEPVCWAGNAETCCALADCQTGTTPLIFRESKGTFWCAAAQASNFKAGILLPLLKEAERFGVLGIFSRQEDAFNDAEVRLLKELADDLGFGIAGQRSDVARRQVEERLRLFERAVVSSANGIMISDTTLPDKPIIYVNPAFERITGYAATEVLQRNARFLLGQDLEQLELGELRSALRQNRESRVTLRNYRRDGALFWNELSVAPVKGEGSVSHFVGVINDISERKHYQEQLEHQSTHDALTGLANRVLLLDRLSQAMLYSERSGRCAAVLFIDLDRFKDVNDTLGHGVGDQVLRAAATRIRSCVRDGDTVARLGGDEFVIVLVDIAQEEDVAALARKILAVLVEPLPPAEDAGLLLGASIGAALFPRDGSSAESLLMNADVAMYRAKEQGGNTLSFFAAEMEVRTRHRLNIESRLRRALEQEEFVLHYQPQVNLASGQICGAEALLRWYPKEGDIVFPSEFIPMAEKSGLILPIGNWVVATAAAQMRRWLDSGMPVVPVAINLSARQFQQPGLSRAVQTELARTNLESRWLELEITESVTLDNLEPALALLREFKDMGHKIALDDFGTGYSSLSYLKRLPIDIVKIDRSFVTDVTTKPEDATIVQAIIGMAHSLGLKVVAEGVETEEQRAYLTGRGCDAMQGFLFSRALPPEAFATLLMEERGLSVAAHGDRQRTLLLVDDEPNVIAALKRALRQDHYRILSAASGTEALQILATEHIHVVISDQRMPGMSGIDFLTRVRQIHPETVRIILSGYTNLETVLQAVNRSAVSRILCKPWDDDNLREAVLESFLLYEARLRNLSLSPNDR